MLLETGVILPSLTPPIRNFLQKPWPFCRPQNYSMSAIDPKSKMVSFRLSAEQYERAEQACREHGYRSVSLFARNAMLAFYSDGTASGSQRELMELRRRLDKLVLDLQLRDRTL